MDTIAEIAAALTTMEEVKRLQRQRAWAVLPDRYQALRKHLISIKVMFGGLSEAQQTALQNAIQQFAGIEDLLERTPAPENAEKTVIKLNRRVSEQIDAIQQVLVEVRNSREV